jgi:hypothetical protein
MPLFTKSFIQIIQAIPANSDSCSLIIYPPVLGRGHQEGIPWIEALLLNNLRMSFKTKTILNLFYVLVLGGNIGDQV